MSNSLFRQILLLGFGLLTGFATAAGDDVQLTGPFTHENLSIYLVRGPNGVKTNLVPLQQAMAQKKVAVYETGNVSQLSIENTSGEDVYVQSGDIVKGGRQDRVLTTDFVLPAHSGKVPITSFCVEQGRWSKRGAESDTQFSASTQTVPSKDLKMAVKDKGAQMQVWNQVAASRAKLSMPAGLAGGVVGGVVGGAPTAAPPPPPPPSSTSMQTALETRQVVDATDTYMKALSKVVDEHPGASGYVYVINGEINSAEIYANPELFRQMWPKLLRASATEALAEKLKATSTKPPAAAAVKAILAEADRGTVSAKETAGRSTVTRRDSAKVVLFETHDPKSAEAWIHRSYVLK
jgi:hypothetical protein